MSKTGQSIELLSRLVDRFLPTANDDRAEASRAITQVTQRITDLVIDRGSLQQQIDTLTAERNEAREGYHKLDSNWAAIHDGAMEPIRSALDLPDGSVLEIVTAIENLKQGYTNPHTCQAVGGNDCRYCMRCGKDMPLQPDS